MRASERERERERERDLDEETKGAMTAEAHDHASV